MPFAPRTLVLLVLAALPALALGCSRKGASGDPETIRRQSELTEIYEIYTMYAKNFKHPPKQVADLNQREYQGIYPIGLQALRSGQYIAVWGVSSKDPGTVLAYEKDAPTKGGPVVMADGTVKTMTAEQLQAALKAKT
jgi:hypothetical protein